MVCDTISADIDYGQIVKTFGNTPEEGTAARYSPGQVVSVDRWAVIGNPDQDRICTSHVERKNKTLRMQIRRFTRLTDGHSKKWVNHEAAVALFIAYYNYARVHGTLTDTAIQEDGPRRRTTPAMVAGLTDHVWSVAELLDAVGVPR